MGPKLLAGAVALLAVTALGVLTSFLISESRPFVVSPSRTPSALGRSIEARARGADAESQTWAVLKASSAHHALVVEVEAMRPEEAMKIAMEIVEPVRDREYEEILIYVQPVRAGTNPPIRRIQWTPRGGYVESTYSGD